MKHQNVLLFYAKQHKNSIYYAITYKIVGTATVCNNYHKSSFKVMLTVVSLSRIQYGHKIV